MYQLLQVKADIIGEDMVEQDECIAIKGEEYNELAVYECCQKLMTRETKKKAWKVIKNKKWSNT